MILGVFCAAFMACPGLPSNWVIVEPKVVYTQCGSVSEITAPDQTTYKGAYIDDTVGSREKATLECVLSQPNHGIVWSGKYGSYSDYGSDGPPNSYGGLSFTATQLDGTELVEWYPSLDPYPCTPPGPSGDGCFDNPFDWGTEPSFAGGGGYIAQAFSWGDNLTDGIARGRCTSTDTTTTCAAKYSRPTVTQMHWMWCELKGHSPYDIVFYYDDSINEQNLILYATGWTC